MKIFYAVQATGNGHISRAKQLLPYLQKFGTVDILLSGSNATLKTDLPVKYRSKGISLFYKKCGGLNYWDIATKNKYLESYTDAHKMPVDAYDIVINDFDFVTARACKLRSVPSVQFGHQASFMSPHTPRPHRKNIFGELILKHYAPATRYLGLHFRSYDEFIKPPVIKKEILDATPIDKGHITVYLPSYNMECLVDHFKTMKDVTFHWFVPHITHISQDENIIYHPINNALFTQSMIECTGILTGGGFETPAEALYLGKKLIAVPIVDHYEQQCNAAALEKLGATVWKDINCDTLVNDLREWLSTPYPEIHIEANNITETLTYLMDTYPRR